MSHVADVMDERRELFLSLQKAEAERDEALGHLKNLLAVIHRDGGHYTERHGLAKSVQEACSLWAGIITKASRLGATIK